MKILRRNKLFTVITTTCILVTFFACHKDFLSSTVENTSVVRDAKTYYSNLVSSEESLLAMPYNQLKKTANLRRFARIGKMNSLLKWNKAQSSYRNGTSYAIVPVEDHSTHQANPNFESIRCLLFFQRDGDKMEMNIVEVYRRKELINGADLLRSVKICAENKLFNENKPVVELNASVIFYDEYYYNRASFSTTNGAWQPAKIVIENTSKRFTSASVRTTSVQANNGDNFMKRSLNTVSPMSGCSVCTVYVVIGIWYDKQTLAIMDSEILDSWDDCIEPDHTPIGNAPGTALLQSNLASDTKTVSNNVNNPCIGATLNKIANTLKSFVTTAQNNENIYMPINLNFNDVTTLGQDVGGQLMSMYTGSDGILNFDISLNLNLLPNMAVEYAAQVMLHEALHGVLLSNGVAWDGVLQHNEIANYYRSLMSSTLQSLFPGLSNGDAEALAWSGLKASTAWNALPSWKKSNINDILGAFGSNNAGTPC